ncbi:helix-turn-helix transcriptional regulator [Flagellimonas allohymeniacidonis]|uniref:DNA-binding protein n=1 Tax=Flagellimonas allohymeniacidonis TaxID=2517819 RepID=A0A4Q8QGV0_9FLAO|nr:helix-turn-helix domain-containing protein [Allomuricauda hymeniacidonis]TAI48468.1 DNA-binding protein [Allomuricauda hymeniacidonis]
MHNPFEILEARLNSIENLILDLKKPSIQFAPKDNPEPFLTVDGVASLLDIAKPTVYTKHSKGELPGGYKRGKRLYFDRETILNWIKEGHQKSKVEIEADAEAFLNSKK